MGRDLYGALLQFFTLFPKLQPHDFFVSGESYGGKYVPALAYTIHQQNPASKLKINLKGTYEEWGPGAHHLHATNLVCLGLSMGNGLSDPEHQLKYGLYLYQLGLIDLRGLKAVQSLEATGLSYIQSKQFDKAFEVFDSLLNGDFNNHSSLFKNISGFDNYFNFLYPEDPLDVELGLMGKYVQRADVRAAIHVGNTSFSDEANVVEVREFHENCSEF